jgi:hypothetical protein
MFKKDTVWLGLGAGLFFPALAFLIVEFIKENLTVLAKDDLFYIGCVALNLLLLKYADKKDMDLAYKGIIAATFICALIFFIYKFNQV